MAETTQILLVVVVTVLTILLTVIGIQIVFILKEFRRTIEKMNKILDDVEIASASVSKSVAGLTGVTTGLKTVLSLIGLFKKEKEK